MASASQIKNPDVILFPISDIVVDREIRQRTRIDDKDIENLAADMQQNGQLHPVTLRQEPYGQLVAGERRLEAAKLNNWTHLRVQFLENLDPISAYRIELSENLKRRALPWQDEVRSVFVYHEMRRKAFPGWTMMGTATDLQMSHTNVKKYLNVGSYLGDEEVMACPTLDGAFNLLKGRAERARAAAANRGHAIAQALPTISSASTKEERTDALAKLITNTDLDKPIPERVDEDDFALLEAGELARASLAATVEQEKAVANLSSPIITGSFIEWVETYDGPPFDVLHCDFPYGKGYEGSNTRRTGRAHICPTYADDPDIHWELLEALLTWQDKLAYPHSHLIYWYDMMYHQAIIDTITAAGWTLSQPFPLIWHKPYQGNAADPKRRPRHTYETALLFSRGDRKLVRLDQDVYVGRVDEKLHINQKAPEPLKQFLSMVVDEHSAVFDPTCGSGSALAVAKQLGSPRVLGVELDPTNAEVARFVLARDGEKVDE